MKSRETLIRLKKFQVGEKRRKVAQIEGMILQIRAHRLRPLSYRLHPRVQLTCSGA